MDFGRRVFLNYLPIPAKELEMENFIDREQSKLDPKLRMLANGSQEVNTLRAERSPAIAVVDPDILEEIPLMREPDASPEQVPEKVVLKAAKGAPDNVYVNVLIELKEGAEKLPDAVVRPDPDLPPPVYMGNLVLAC